jgi:heat shock protein HtpX
MTIPKTNFYKEIQENNWRTFGLFLVFALFIVGFGWLIGLYLGDMIAGLILTLIVGAVYALIAYLFGSAMILAMSGAKEATKPEYTYYINTVEGLALAAGIPTPKCYVIHDSALNAFATGISPKHGAVTVTTGLLAKLNRQELEGVIAHEIAHIKNYDIRTMLIASVFVGLVTLLSDFFLRLTIFGTGHRDSDRGDARFQIIMLILGLLLAILAPIVAYLIKLAVSRKREFVADAEGARLTRYPEGLASALEKIAGDPDPLVDGANKATAHMYISTPFRKKKSFWINMFSTHPPIEERIKRLRAM